MVFVAPSIIDGALVWGLIYISPLLIGVFVILLGLGKDNSKLMYGGVVLCILLLCFSNVAWFELMEVPSVDEKVVTVQEWQPNKKMVNDDRGVMTIDNADQLVLVTTDGETFQNTEHIWFMKFETRDILNHLKPGGTYRIRYYGWRNGWTSTYPNILGIEEVIDEDNINVTNSYFGTRIV